MWYGCLAIFKDFSPWSTFCYLLVFLTATKKCDFLRILEFGNQKKKLPSVPITITTLSPSHQSIHFHEYQRNAPSNVHFKEVHLSTVLIWVSIAAIKHHNQNASWDGKSLLGLQFKAAVPHWRKSKIGQDPGVRSWERPWKELPAGLLPMACLFSHLIEPRVSSAGMTPPTIGWASPIDL